MLHYIIRRQHDQHAICNKSCTLDNFTDPVLGKSPCYSSRRERKQDKSIFSSELVGSVLSSTNLVNLMFKIRFHSYMSMAEPILGWNRGLTDHVEELLCFTHCRCVSARSSHHTSSQITNVGPRAIPRPAWIPSLGWASAGDVTRPYAP